MICKNCGAKLSDKAIFCGSCGCGVNMMNSVKNEISKENSTIDTIANESKQNIQEDFIPIYSLNNNKPNKKRTIWYVIIIVLLFVSLGLTTVFVCFVIADNIDITEKSDSSEQQTSEAVETATPVITTTPAATAAPTPAPTVMERITLYNAGYTYKRMDDIHNSVSAADEEFIEIGGVINHFDELCENYMNYGDEGVFIYLKPGTTAYNQQVEYKRNHATISEKYLDVKTVDVRKSSSFYYAWTYEEIEVTENGATTIERSNWVYKLQKSGSGYIIVDYTADPAYK